MLNEKIKNLRKQNNLTQEELADKLCVSRQAITKWETGAGVPDIANIEAIAKLFGVTFDELLSENPSIARDNVSRTEFDIFKKNDFEITFDTLCSLSVTESDFEKVVVEIRTDLDAPAYKLMKVKLINGKNSDFSCIKIQAEKKFVLPNGKLFSKQDAKSHVFVTVILPKELAKDVELNGTIMRLNLHDFAEYKHVEFDGKVEDVTVERVNGHFELTSGTDMNVRYDGSMAQLDINQLNAITTLYLKKDAKVNVYNKGRSSNVIFDGYDNFEDSDHKVELNGRKAELTVKYE